MKNSLFLLIIFSLIISCKEEVKQSDADNCPDPSSYEKLITTKDYVSGPSPVKQGDYLITKMNEECWKVPAYIEEDDDSLLIFGLGDEQWLRIKFKFDGVGTYELTDNGNERLFGNTVEYSTTVGKDVVISRFTLKNVGILSVTEHDVNQGIIIGTFQFNMERVYTYSGQDPEIINFSSGKFRLHLPD